ncbi:hypothetical protein KCU78_g4939, partial [Aureobasidium melanogenum]
MVVSIMSASANVAYEPQTPPPSKRPERYTSEPSSENTSPSNLEKSLTSICGNTSASSWWGPSAMLLDDEPTTDLGEVEVYRRVRHGLLLHPAGMHIYIMPTHFESATCKEICDLRKKVSLSGGMFVQDISKAKLILTRVWRERRAMLDLRTRGIKTKVEESEDECFWKVQIGPDTISVVNLEWLEDSWKAGRILDMDEYVVHHGRVVHQISAASTTKKA